MRYLTIALYLEHCLDKDSVELNGNLKLHLLDKMLVSGVNSNIAHQTSKGKNESLSDQCSKCSAISKILHSSYGSF